MTSTSKNNNNLNNYNLQQDNILQQDYNLNKANNASDQTTNLFSCSANVANQAIREIVATEQNKLGNSANLNQNIKSEMTDICQRMSSATMSRSGIYRKL